MPVDVRLQQPAKGGVFEEEQLRYRESPVYPLIIELWEEGFQVGKVFWVGEIHPGVGQYVKFIDETAVDSP